MKFKFVHDGDHTDYLIPLERVKEFEESKDLMIHGDFMIEDCSSFDKKRGDFKIRPDEIIINSYDKCSE